jgi:hypothetical protein
LDLPAKTSQCELSHKPLNEWLEISNEARQKQEFDDKGSIIAGFQHIMELNPCLAWLEDQVNGPANSIQEAFDVVRVGINHVQLATAAFVAANATHTKYQVMEVPAGQGKSRIAAAIAYFVLNHSTV